MDKHETTTIRPLEGPASPFGAHRVVSPVGALPQAADRLDNDFSRLFDGELLVDVETLNLDAASYRQMAEDGRLTIPEIVLETVRTRGKQHNPVTGSGGMLLGHVRQATPGHPDAVRLVAGARIATLVSLTLTPLRIDEIVGVRDQSAQIDVRGEAVLFATGPYVVMPQDLPERLVLAAMDVAGAAPQIARLVSAGDRVVILGAGGKSGVLSTLQARRAAGDDGTVIGVESDAGYADELERLGLADHVVRADATEALAVREAVLAKTGGREADVVVSCVNVPNVEMSAILITRPRGSAYFFAMSTSFTRAVLGAEGAGRDIELRMGNGFAIGHAEYTLELLRAHAPVRALFERRYA